MNDGIGIPKMKILNISELPFTQCPDCKSFGINKNNPGAGCLLCKNKSKFEKGKEQKKNTENHDGTEETYLESSIPIFCDSINGIVETTILRSCTQIDINECILHSSNLNDFQKSTIKEIMFTTNQFANEYRQGYFVADGAGTGKGRIIAGAINEYMQKGLDKHIWISSSPDLLHDAERDLRDVHSQPELIFKLSSKLDKLPHRGVMFVTYSTLIQKNRLEQIIEWCGNDFNGIVAFDECHKGKHAHGSKISITSKKMIELQNTLHGARCIYLSATACISPKYMAYMPRLGLWGDNTHFPKFENFQKCMSKMSVLSNEIIALHLKINRRFCSRHMSYEGLTFHSNVVDIDPNQISIYDAACKTFAMIYSLEEVRSSQNRMHFGNTSLRFFRALISSFKLERLFEIIDKHIDSHSIIVNIQSTWEAHQDLDCIDAPYNILSSYMDIVSSYSESAREFINNLRKTMLVKCSAGNPLDMIIEKYGRDNVAELTGRSRDKSNVKTESNIDEARAFNNGSKSIAVISEAASQGISLHSSETFVNQKQRFHIMFELPWSVEQFVQQLGRSHRNGQVHTPHYELIATSIPGEQRFISGICRRLKLMGAMLNGNRDSLSFMMNDYDSMDSSDCLKALNHAVVEVQDNMEEMYKICMKDMNKTSSYLNKIICMPICYQDAIFEKYRESVMHSDSKQKCIQDIVCKRAVIENEEHVSDCVSKMHISVYNDPVHYEDLKNGTFRIMNKKLVYIEEKTNSYKIYRPEWCAPKTHNTKRNIKLWSQNVPYSMNVKNEWNIQSKEVKTSLHMVTGDLLSIWDSLQTKFKCIKARRIRISDRAFVGIVLKNQNDF